MARSAKKKLTDPEKSTPKKKTTAKKSSTKTPAKTETVGGGADETADSDWARKKPTKEGEVTVVLKHGATFTGLLVKEDDTTITLKMGAAEMEWPKRDLQEIIRFEGSSSGSGIVANKLKWPIGK